jgi:hypothetical protein
VNLPRHERIAELLVLVISLALLLERFPRLSMSFSSVMRLSWSGLIRPSATGDDLLCIVLIAEAL